MKKVRLRSVELSADVEVTPYLGTWQVCHRGLLCADEENLIDALRYGREFALEHRLKLFLTYKTGRRIEVKLKQVSEWAEGYADQA